MKKILKYLPISLACFVLLASTAMAQFQEPSQAGTGLPVSDPNTVIKYVVQWFLSAVGIVALVILVWAGISYMTAGGDEEKVTKAKARLTYGIIGVVVAIGGLIIMQFIVNALGTTGPGTLTL